MSETQGYRWPHQIVADALPPMDPKERERVIEIAKLALWEVLQKRLAEGQAREREWRKKQPGEDAVSRGIRKAERRIERRLLAVMEGDLKASLGPKPWDGQQLMRLAAKYRRIKHGAGVSGIRKPKRQRKTK